ncbi:hypothetical protein KM043_011911 [Ampulex compressa]|nr:hypothetical protein KM043_011911 [Ampulex compressa]
MGTGKGGSRGRRRAKVGAQPPRGRGKEKNQGPMEGRKGSASSQEGLVGAPARMGGCKKEGAEREEDTCAAGRACGGGGCQKVGRKAEEGGEADSKVGRNQRDEEAVGRMEEIRRRERGF